MDDRKRSRPEYQFPERFIVDFCCLTLALGNTEIVLRYSSAVYPLQNALGEHVDYLSTLMAYELVMFEAMCLCHFIPGQFKMPVAMLTVDTVVSRVFYFCANTVFVIHRNIFCF